TPQVSNLFIYEDGRPMNSNGLEKLVRRMQERVSVKGGTHILRHTMATLFLQSNHDGGSLERLRLILGHTSLIVTQRYLHLNTTDLVWRPGLPTPLERLGL